jgi:beta-lactamase class A
LTLAASLSIAALTAGSAALAEPAGDIGVQASAASRSYHNLREAIDTGLQQQLRRSIRELKLENPIDDKRLSVALVDVTDEQHPRMAMLNGDEMMYAASLPKIAILFGAFQKVYEGRLRLDDNLRGRMVDMIRYSSNEAATYVLNKVGRGYLAGLLQSRRYRFYDASLNGGLWVGKAYASGSAYQRDPLHNISHGATAYQVARFLYMMETGLLVSPEYSREMKEMMSDPGIHHKFVKGLEEARPDARIYRKSGTWRDYHADGAIIERAGRRYIAVALAEDRRGGEWMRQLIVALDDIVFSQPKPIQSASLQ